MCPRLLLEFIWSSLAFVIKGNQGKREIFWDSFSEFETSMFKIRFSCRGRWASGNGEARACLFLFLQFWVLRPIDKSSTAIPDGKISRSKMRFSSKQLKNGCSDLPYFCS